MIDVFEKETLQMLCKISSLESSHTREPFVEITQREDIFQLIYKNIEKHIFRT
jgi:hypothetical protein